MRFAVLALLGAVTAVLADPQRARRLLREPVFAVLVVLGVLGAVSAAWTTGITDDALRWGLVTVGFAAVALAAAVLAPRPRAIEGAAALIAVLAVAMGVIGLVAAAVTDEPLSHRAAGLWRPASTFQYSPALALLIVSALPPLLTAMCRARRWWAVLGAGAGGAVAGATLALAESRTQLAFAVLVAAAALVWPQRLVRAPRGAVAAALAVMAAAGLGAYAVNGGYVPITPAPDGTARLLALLGVLAAGTLAWLLVSAALRRGAPAAALAALLLALGGAAVIAKPPAKLISAGIVGHTERPKRPLRPAEPRTNHAIRDRLLHGRVHLWGEAIETFADRPLQGGGADSYWFASAEHQGTRTVFYAHSLPLELAAELGIAGLLLSIGLYAASGRALWRRRTGPARWLLGPAATAFLAANLVDWPWHLAGAGAVWALALGAIVGAPGATRDGH